MTNKQQETKQASKLEQNQDTRMPLVKDILSSNKPIVNIMRDLDRHPQSGEFELFEFISTPLMKKSLNIIFVS